MVPFRLRLWLQSESRQWQLLEERARTASARSRALLAPKPMPTNIVIDCNRQLQAHAANFIANESLPRLLRLRVAVGVVLGVGRLDMMSEWKWGENISFIFGGQFGQRHLEDIVFSAGKVGGTKHNKPLLLSARVFAATTGMMNCASTTTWRRNSSSRQRWPSCDLWVAQTCRARCNLRPQFPSLRNHRTCNSQISR